MERFPCHIMLIVKLTFFNIYRNEYYLADLNLAPSQNVLRKTGDNTIEELEVDEDDNVENIEESSDTKKHKQKDKVINIDNDEEVITIDDSDEEETEKKEEETVRRSSRIGTRSHNVADDTLGVQQTTGSRTRTRSQSEVSDAESELDIRTQGAKKQNVELKSVNDENKESKSSVAKKPRITRAKTRSMSESGTDMDTAEESVAKKPVTRRRTRHSSKTDDIEIESDMDTAEDSVAKKPVTRRRTRHSSKTDDIEFESDMDTENEVGTDADDDEIEIENKIKPKRKRLSAINEVEEVNEKSESKKINEKGESTKGKGKDKKAGKGKKENTSKGGDTVEVKKRGKAATSSLVVQLELFAKFTDPLCMYMEPELKQLYLDVSVLLFLTSYTLIPFKLLKTFSPVFFAHPIAQVFRSLKPQGLRVRIPLEA